MGALFDELQKCRVFTPGCSPLAMSIVEVVRVAYGGPIRSTTECPPGPEPVNPNNVIEMVGVLPAIAIADEATKSDAILYIQHEYDAALTAWVARKSFCAQAKLPKQPKNGNGNGAPPKPSDATRTEGIFIVLAMIGIYGAARIVGKRLGQ